jgi:hypothetical protein
MEVLMDKQNVTVSIPQDILQKAKVHAAEQNMSLSNLVTQALVDMLGRADQYEQAKEGQFALLQQGFDMGTQGKANWTRAELHER